MYYTFYIDYITKVKKIMPTKIDPISKELSYTHKCKSSNLTVAVKMLVVDNL